MITNHHHSLIYAHRGVTKAAADNTRLAFTAALKHNIDGIETDLQLSKDGVSVLYHDRLMEKLGHSARSISNFSFAELKQINFLGPAATTTEGPITVAEFVNSYSSRCRLQIEIKHREWEDDASAELKVQHCLACIKVPTNNAIVVSSFAPECLAYAHQLGTTIPLIYGFKETHHFSAIKHGLEQHPFLSGVCCHIDTLNPTLMRYLREQNKQVLSYTCNTTHTIQKALDLRVDVLLTDEPATALAMRSAWEAGK